VTVVADASPLIALVQVGHLPLLEKLFGEVLVPSAVVREVGVSLPGFIRERKLSQPIPATVSRASLDPGESEAISLALELGADRLILDERLARRLAQELGLPIIGVLGILLASKQKGLIPAVRPILDALVKNRFRITPDLYEWLLAETGEAEPQR
jgi:predicted nucleic acid-binding protein